MVHSHAVSTAVVKFNVKDSRRCILVPRFNPLLLLQCTNKKAWKDIAAQLGIGPSSSGAYTLKKHYGKNLLPFECHFERGGIDPAPILAQVEAQSKKKGKGGPRAPSPGSQVRIRAVM